MKTFLLIVGSLLGPGLLVAKLSFDSNLVTVTAEPGATSVPVYFPFMNDGDHPVTIIRMDTTCGCTTSELEKLRYEPGEWGEIEARLDVGPHSGVQQQHVRVVTDDPTEPEHHLTLRVQVPELIQLNTRMLHWRVDEAPSPKKVRVQIAHTEPIHVTEVLSGPHANFSVELKEVEKGRAYEVIATPGSTDGRHVANIVIVTDFPEAQPRRLPVTLRVY